jgi:dethiobiotin synthetase
MRGVRTAGVFVTGTGTNVGKTVISAAVLHRYRRAVPLQYWKAVQTGIPQDDDTATLKELAGCTAEEIQAPGYALPRPLSPHLAARLCGESIELSNLIRIFQQHDATRSRVVEGAGGVLVPLNSKELMVDFIFALDLPVIVVALSQLGTINHTLLTLDALRSRAITIAGVVLNGEPNLENQRAIETYGKVAVLGAMPPFPALNSATLAAWSTTQFDRDNCLAPYLEMPRK